jgi:preprotein translocase subunit SecA
VDEPDGGFDLDDDDSDEADGSLDDEGALVDPIEPYVAPPKIGRNEPCHCGSGKKFKRCCGD